MKNRKRVLTLLIVLICLLATILVIVHVFGAVIKNKKIKDYFDAVENATCDLAKTDNYTKEICDSYVSLCKIRYNKLIQRKYLDADLINPITKKKVSENTKDYIEITWVDGKMVCTLKEG